MRPIDRALDRGIRYVLESQDATGAWSDFELDGTESDAWVTAYTGCAVHGAGGVTVRPVAAALAAAGAHLLASFPGRGGWGFNGHAPIDGDSTAWGISFLAATAGVPPAAYDALRTHRRPDGGFSCYQRFSDASTQVSHADVSALALSALLHEPARDRASASACAAYLAGLQLPDGSWPSYWYATRLYSVVHVLRALASYDASALQACDVAAAMRYAAAAALAGDAFSLALAAEALLRFGEPGTADGIVDELLGLQRIDGRWTAGAPFMRPDPWNYAGDEGNAAVLDQYGLFTTATVLRALALAVRAPHRAEALHA